MKEFKKAFITSIPILFGYLFLGIAFGVLLSQAGFNFVWAFFASIFIYAGTGQFLLVSLLMENASLILVAAMTLFINCRHIFYGISFVDRFKKMGKAYPYMIFSLTDETYSLLCAERDKKGYDTDNKKLFYIALFDHLYWIMGSVIGALMGQYIPIDFTGIDFSMTALFVASFTEQWITAKDHVPALTGLLSTLLCLLLFGREHFLIPAMLLITLVLTLLRRREEGTA
ncbi:MAG: AzlC family ABC transporter permease [Oscillospiraceae bacterium]|nr:AzlC family ABC transporter permease [Oscillospiraceae bacterium]